MKNLLWAAGVFIFTLVMCFSIDFLFADRYEPLTNLMSAALSAIIFLVIVLSNRN